MTYTGPKVRLSRRLGLAITPKAQRVMERKPHPPGEHGQRPRRKTSIYETQLREKQRLRFQYNVSERQLRNYVLKAAGRSGNTGDRLIELLETRLDALVLRAGLARTIYAARQLVAHGHVLVNGARVDRPSHRLQVGDELAVRPASRGIPSVAEEWAAAVLAPGPDYLERNRNAMSARLTMLPQREQVPVVCEIPLVIEYYSK